MKASIVKIIHGEHTHFVKIDFKWSKKLQITEISKK